MMSERDQPQFLNRHRPIVAAAVRTIMASEAPWPMNHSGVFGGNVGMADPPAIEAEDALRVGRQELDDLDDDPADPQQRDDHDRPAARTRAPVAESGGGTSSIAAG